MVCSSPPCLQDHLGTPMLLCIRAVWALTALLFVKWPFGLLYDLWTAFDGMNQLSVVVEGYVRHFGVRRTPQALLVGEWSRGRLTPCSAAAGIVARVRCCPDR